MHPPNREHPGSRGSGRLRIVTEMPRFGGGGVDRGDLVGAVAGWVMSEAMRRLAAASGWPWPDAPLEVTLAELVRRSADWDFRGRLRASPGAARERHTLTSIPAEVGGRVVDEDMIRSAAAELGLAGGRAITGSFSHAVVLGGMARACLNRAREAARRREELGIPRVVVVTAHRPLGGNEPADAAAAGWGELELESEAALAAARDVFDLPTTPDSLTESWWDGDGTGGNEGSKGIDVPEGLDPVEWRRRRSWAHSRWQRPGLEVDVVAAPSSEPAARRTNTADQLVFWAERAGVEAAHRLLLITTDHYVPAQHFEAIRAVGLRFGCGVETCGVEWVPAGAYRGAAYLQEVRSALLAAARLLGALDAPGAPDSPDGPDTLGAPSAPDAPGALDTGVVPETGAGGAADAPPRR